MQQQDIHGEISPNITEREFVALTSDSLVAPVVIASAPVLAEEGETVTEATDSSEAQEGSVIEEGAMVAQSVVLRPRAVSVPSRKFDWKHEDMEIFPFKAWWGDKLLFEVGYLQTPQGLQVSERRVLAEGRKYDSVMLGVVRPLYRVGKVSQVNRIIFVENEPAADELNRRLAVAELAGRMVATTTSRGLGNAHLTDFARYMEGKEIVVLPGNYLGAANDADNICRGCASASKWVKRVQLRDLLPNQTQEDYFRSLEDLGELLELIEAAPISWHNSSMP